MKSNLGSTIWRVISLFRVCTDCPTARVRSNYLPYKTSNFFNLRLLNSFPYKPRRENKFRQFRTAQTTLSWLG